MEPEAVCLWVVHSLSVLVYVCAYICACLGGWIPDWLAIYMCVYFADQLTVTRISYI